jgi:hypothetical protein
MVITSALAPDAALTGADPLTVFLANHRASLPSSRGTKRFNAGEHAWLASRGAERACEELLQQRGITVDAQLFEAIGRRDGREVLQYGELVALSGDFYDSADALFDEMPSALPWLWHANDLSELRTIFSKELKWIEHRVEQEKCGSPYPNENIRLAWNAKSYVELALRNVDHFGWHNICAYSVYHAAAMELSAATGGRRNEDFRRALYTNAFADHFLTDGFAAGHIRVPRAEICSWAEARGLSDKVAGALSKLLHDQDGHVDVHSIHGDAVEEHRGAEDGLLVQDSDGNSWHTYCDGQLFLERSLQSPAVDHAVDAVADSVREFLLAWQRRELPRGNYAATRRVPFPHPQAPTLTQKFPADMRNEDFDRLWESVAWYAKVPWIAGLEREHIRDLFASLPQIMASFRANVAAQATDPDLAARIEPRYIEAYLQIA